ncbi:MAG: SRPBCC domain-containing protein [Burkholderiales bacterium]|nr:SRPBCC domain-containing protein [Burkholderiales bacterium]
MSIFSCARAACLLVTAAMAVMAGEASANVTAFSAHSLQVKHEVNTSVPEAKVYQALLGQVGAWWNPAHTYTKDAKNLSIEARPGGCFCEKFPEGGGIEHLRVVYLMPNQAVRFSGGLGPFQPNGVAGSLSFNIVPI